MAGREIPVPTVISRADHVEANRRIIRRVHAKRIRGTSKGEFRVANPLQMAAGLA